MSSDMRAKPWNARAKNAFFLYAALTTITGVWPHEDTLFLKSRIFLSCVEAFISSISAAGKLVVGCGGIDETIDTIVMLVFGLLICGKLLILYVYRDKLIIIVNSAFTDWESNESEQNTAIMMGHSRTCNTMSRIFYGAGLFSCVFYVLKMTVFSNSNVILSDSVLNMTVLTNSRVYILPGGCIYDGCNEYIYYFVVVNQAIQLFVSCTANLGIDSMFVALVIHLCGQFELLQLELEKIGTENDLPSNRKSLGKMVARHCHLMQIAKLLEDVYNGVIFIQMFTSVVTISVGGVSLIVNLKLANIMGVAKAFGVMQFMLIQSYIYTYPSDNLANQSDGLIMALYKSEWYRLPASLTKDIVFVMMRINLPPYLTAGKFFCMTRRSYMDVIKTAGSYLSVLRIMIE